VRIAWPGYDGTLTLYTFEVGYELMTLVYDTLLRRGGGGAPEPWLARRSRNSEAGTRVTVLLREGARWHDGRPLTARDVKFSFDLYARRYHPRFTPQLEAIESTEAVDELTVAFNLQAPVARPRPGAGRRADPAAPPVGGPGARAHAARSAGGQ
jgi:ABC-type transport system substrate-binding protein